METKGDVFLIVRVDPWECYQDTWQTTCSVLEHHRDLMKQVQAKILGKVGQSLSRICCVRPPVERFTFVDENANLGTVMRYEEI
ncbi:Nicotinamide/nicotinic acid mononucleotide adenylyltransferase 2, partial [Camelus dromedarius]